TINVTGGSLLNGVVGTVDVGLIALTDANAPFQIFTNEQAQGAGSFPPLQFQPAISTFVAPFASFGVQSAGQPVCRIGPSNMIYGINFPATTISTGPDGNAWWLIDCEQSGQGPEAPQQASVNAVVVGLNSNSFMGRWHRSPIPS